MRAERDIGKCLGVLKQLGWFWGGAGGRVGGCSQPERVSTHRAPKTPTALAL